MGPLNLGTLGPLDLFDVFAPLDLGTFGPWNLWTFFDLWTFGTFGPFGPWDLSTLGPFDLWAFGPSGPLDLLGPLDLWDLWTLCMYCSCFGGDGAPWFTWNQTLSVLRRRPVTIQAHHKTSHIPVTRLCDTKSVYQMRELHLILDASLVIGCFSCHQMSFYAKHTLLLDLSFASLVIIACLVVFACLLIPCNSSHLGPLGPWTLGPWDRWTFGPWDFRTSGLRYL